MGAKTPPPLSCDSPRVAELGDIPCGLHVSRYGGGEDFSPGTCLLHHRLTTPALTGELKQRILEWCEAALQRHTASLDEPTVTLPHPKGVDWSLLSWEEEVCVWMPPPSSDRSNLFYHGWLWKDGRKGDGSGTAFPLVGLLDPTGCLGHLAPGTLGLLGDGPLCGEGELRPSENHWHCVDPWAGGTKEDYIGLLVESEGLDPVEAAERAEVEAIVANEPHFGADMAQVAVKAEGQVGHGTVVCVDLRLPSRPRALVSSLYLVKHGESGKLAETALATWKAVGEGGYKAAIAALTSALPAFQQPSPATGISPLTPPLEPEEGK